MAIVKRRTEEDANTLVEGLQLSDVEINILHMYPHEMNIYGDYGNVLCLKRRIAWRGIRVNVFQMHLNGKFTDEKGNIVEKDIKDFDIYFMGGGQDTDQADVYQDLLKYKNEVKELVEAGKVFLLICGGYQLFGKSFLTIGGKAIDGLGILDVDTVGGATRCIGNIVINSTLPELKDKTFVGFENHSGRTKLLSDKVKVFGNVVHGFGNDVNDGKEGGYYKNVYGCYLHGSFLPKNPEFADLLIRKSIDQKYPDNKIQLAELDDYIEKYAREKVISRFTKE